MIPGVDIVSVGEVEEHALAVPHQLVPTFPRFARVSGYSNFVLKLNECYCWGNTVSLLVEVFTFLSMFRSFENFYCFKFQVLKLWDSLCKVLNLIFICAINFFERINT